MEINVGGRGGGKTFTEDDKKGGRPVGSYTVQPPPDYILPRYMKEYITKKIKMLTKEFHLKLSEEEIARFWTFKEPDQVDRYAHRLFQKYL